MTKLWLRVLLGAILGAALGPTALVIVNSINSGVHLEMDRDASAVLRGLYDVERAGTMTFAWTRRQTTLTLPGLDRRRDWSCRIVLRAGRPDPTTTPQVTVAVDGATVAREQTTNDWTELAFKLPARAYGPGAVVTLTASSTFQPSAEDSRPLGVMLDRWICEPARAGVVWPPVQSLAAAAMGLAAIGAACALVGLMPLALTAGLVVTAIAQAIPLSWEVGPFSSYLARVPWLAVWIGGMAAVMARLLGWRFSSLSGPARLVVALSAAVLYIKLLALLHPSKLVVDAVFHAHRLDWVMTGRYFFTQPLPSGVQFPYAIGLYVFAAPWTAIARDHVALLRIVVMAAEVFAGALLYPMISRSRNDGLAGVMAVVLFSAVPLSFWTIGNANLTNVFGQAVALVTIASIALWSLQSRAIGTWLGLWLLTSLALLSHVSTFAMLVTTLVAAAILFRWRGGKPLAVPSRVIMIITILAVIFAVATYYRHFGEAYQRLGRVSAASAASTPQPAQTPHAPIYERVGDALFLSARAINWPILVLAIGGLAAFVRDKGNRLAWLLGAWGVAYAVFLGVAVLTPVAGPFERYAAEFVGRVVYGTYPAAVILAAVGFASAWRAGGAWRLAAAALAGWAFAVASQDWMDWLR
jgi:hypothetical protein